MTRVCTTVSPTLAPGAARVSPPMRRADAADGGWDARRSSPGRAAAMPMSATGRPPRWPCSDADSEAVRGALLDRLADADRPTRDQALLGLALRRDARAIGPLIRALGEDARRFAVLLAAARRLPFACGGGGAQDAVLDRALGRCRGAA